MAEKTVEELQKELEEALAKMKRLEEEAEKNKTAQSKASSEAAEYKRKLAEKQTAEEKAAQEREELEKQRAAENQELKEKIAVLTKQGIVTENKAALVGIGFSAERADSVANTLGDTKISADFLKAFTDHMTDHDKELEAKFVNNTPKPGAGANGGKTVTQEDFNKMSLSEMMKLHDESPELYKQFAKK